MAMQKRPDGPCSTCGGQSPRELPFGGWVCSVCHPDPATVPRDEEGIIKLSPLSTSLAQRRQRDYVARMEDDR